MARTLTLSDGTITANLLNTNTTWGLDFEGWEQGDPQLNQIRRESIYGEGVGLIHSVAPTVIETFKVDLAGTSHDNLAATLQALMTLAEEARQFHTTRWQKTPVYLTAQTNTETNTRYALVYDVRLKLGQQLYGVITDRENYIEHATITVEREPYWRSAIPLSTLPTALTTSAAQAPSGQVVATEQFIANHRDTNALTHVYNFDTSLSAFSSNLIASTNFDYYAVSGSTPASGDIVYFGSTSGPFRQVICYIGTASNPATSSVAWEIWTGAAWVGSIVKVPVNPVFGAAAGNFPIYIDTPTGWATTAINGVTAYWIRVRLTASPAWTTNPRQGAQVVYNPRENYVSVAATQLNGDVDSLGLIAYKKYVQVNNDIRWMAIGLKSRGLTNFVSNLNWGGNNPAEWTVSAGTDTSTTADIESPSGTRATCTFATNQTLVERIRITNGTAASSADYEGTYHVYARVQQTGGSAGDVSIRIGVTITNGIGFSTATVPLTAVSGGIELISLGRITIIAPRLILGTESSNGFYIQLDAKAVSATPDLRLYDIILIPVDEWSIVPSHAGLSGQQVYDYGSGLDVDNGLLRWGVTQKGPDGATPPEPNRVISQWESRGQLPLFPPDKAFRLYFLMSDNATAGTYLAPLHHGGSIKLYAHQRWVFMRGNE